MSYCLAEKTWPEVEAYLKNKKHIIIPVGSTEQHGPNGIIGIDYLTAQEISQAVGNQTQTLVTPPLCFGMALHHMAFPGTISLTPITYIQVVSEIIQSLAKHGFEEFTIINGHGGNIAPLTSAMSQVKQNSEKHQIRLINWWHLPEVTAYEQQHFGELNGFHATCGEVSVTMHTHPQAYKDPRPFNYFATPSKHHWPMGPVEFREHFKDGRMGSNPQLASAEHGKQIFALAIKAIAHKINP